MASYSYFSYLINPHRLSNWVSILKIVEQYLRPDFLKRFDKEVAYITYYIPGHHNWQELFQSVETSRSTCWSQSIELLGYLDILANLSNFWKAVKQFCNKIHRIQESNHYKCHLAQVEAPSEEPITDKISGEDFTIANKALITTIDKTVFQSMIKKM